MERHVTYVNEDFLDDIKSDFYTNLVEVYKNLGPIESVKTEIGEIFSKQGVNDSDIKFTYEPLKLGSDEDEDNRLAAENIKRVYQSLSILTPSQAAMERVWVALLNTHYLDYHLHVIRGLQGSKDASKKIYDRTFLKGPVHSDKRRLMMNNLSVLWWIGYYTHDSAHPTNPFHLTDFFASTPYRGNAIAFFSSNIHGSRDVTLGILEGVKHLVESGVISVNRYAYTNSSKIINIIAGVKLVDMMTREEVKKIIIEELPKSDGILVVKDNLPLKDAV